MPKHKYARVDLVSSDLNLFGNEPDEVAQKLLDKLQRLTVQEEKLNKKIEGKQGLGRALRGRRQRIMTVPPQRRKGVPSCNSLG